MVFWSKNQRKRFQKNDYESQLLYKTATNSISSVNVIILKAEGLKRIQAGVQPLLINV